LSATAGRRFWQALAVGVGLSALFVLLLARKLDVADALAAIGRASLPVLAACLLTKLAGFFCLTLRTRALLGVGQRAPFGTLLRSHLLAFAGNNLLPLRAGEWLRIDYLARRAAVPRSRGLAIAVAERLLDTLCVMTLALMLPAVIAGATRLPSPVVLAALGLSAVLAIWAIGRFPGFFAGVGRAIARLGGRRLERALAGPIESFVQGFTAAGSPRSLLAASAWTAAYWLAGLAGIRLWFVAFSLRLPPQAAVLVLVFLSLAMAVPASPGQVGTYEYFVVLALQVFAVDHSMAAAVAVTGHFVALVPFTLVALAAVAGELRSGLRAMARRSPSGGEPA
jgi:uncharacterized protein (TIRG00374 family)